jgi:cell division protease FtsH
MERDRRKEVEEQMNKYEESPESEPDMEGGSIEDDNLCNLLSMTPGGEAVYRHGSRTKLLNASIEAFLGAKEKVKAAVIEPRYYGELMAWALQHYIEGEAWKVVGTTGYYRAEPIYMDVNMAIDKSRKVVMNGCLFLDRSGDRIAVTIDANLNSYNYVVVTGPACREKQVNEFAEGVKRIIKEENFYRGKKIMLGQRIDFLDIPLKRWEDLVLDPATKDETYANTVGFLANLKEYDKYGVLPKRGVLLAGEPGTGKTLISKVIMAQSQGITCLTTNPYSFEGDPCIRQYIVELYELAEDLAPSIVFLEDIDQFAQSRAQHGYAKGATLLSLLSALDGVEEHKGIVTVATTNCLDTLDMAITERPSRFDRVIELNRPTLKERTELISRLCRRIPITEHTKEYIADKTEKFTPAQLQEVIYTLVIMRNQKGRVAEPTSFEFATAEVDCAIHKIYGRRKDPLGFCPKRNNNGQLPEIMRISMKESREIE